MENADSIIESIANFLKGKFVITYGDGGYSVEGTPITDRSSFSDLVTDIESFVARAEWLPYEVLTRLDELDPWNSTISLYRDDGTMFARTVPLSILYALRRLSYEN